MFLKIAFPNVSVCEWVNSLCEWVNSVCEWVNSVWNRSIPRAFTNSYDLKYLGFYIQLHPSVSMKSDPNHIAVYHLWRYTYDLSENLWKLRCTVKCSGSTVIKLFTFTSTYYIRSRIFLCLIHHVDTQYITYWIQLCYHLRYSFSPPLRLASLKFPH